jgi:hypothetical protein
MEAVLAASIQAMTTNRIIFVTPNIGLSGMAQEGKSVARDLGSRNKAGPDDLITQRIEQPSAKLI